MATKITKRDRFNELLTLSEVKANADLVAFINHEIELLERKNGAERKMTPAQKANAGYKQEIVEILRDNGGKMTITEITKHLSDPDMANQRVSALVRQLMAEGYVERVEEKRKAYFRYIDE